MRPYVLTPGDHITCVQFSPNYISDFSSLLPLFNLQVEIEKKRTKIRSNYIIIKLFDKQSTVKKCLRRRIIIVIKCVMPIQILLCACGVHVPREYGLCLNAFIYGTVFSQKTIAANDFAHFELSAQTHYLFVCYAHYSPAIRHIDFFFNLYTIQTIYRNTDTCNIHFSKMSFKYRVLKAAAAAHSFVVNVTINFRQVNKSRQTRAFWPLYYNERVYMCVFVCLTFI